MHHKMHTQLVSFYGLVQTGLLGKSKASQLNELAQELRVILSLEWKNTWRFAVTHIKSTPSVVSPGVQCPLGKKPLKSALKPLSVIRCLK